jgi:hypothetical protein
MPEYIYAISLLTSDRNDTIRKDSQSPVAGAGEEAMESTGKYCGTKQALKPRETPL